MTETLKVYKWELKGYGSYELFIVAAYSLEQAHEIMKDAGDAKYLIGIEPDSIIDSPGVVISHESDTSWAMGDDL